MKNIAIVIDSLAGGGAERVMISLATELVDKGHQVTILSLGNRCDYNIPSGIAFSCLFDHKASKVDRFWQKKASIAKLEHWFAQASLEQGKFDLVLSNLDRSNNLLAQSTISSVYYIIHGSVNGELERERKRGPLAYFYLLKSKRNLSGKNLITVSEGLKKEILTGSIINPETINTIYNPIDIADIQAKAVIIDEAIPDEDYIIHVGRLARSKRHDVLFEAFAKVDNSVKLVLLCNKPKKALKLAKKYGVEKRLVLPGFQSNPYNWIKHAKALVLSSDFEGLPTVLLEALSVNTKVVSTDCPHGPSEILTGQLAKYLVPTVAPEQLAQAINQVLKDDLILGNADILAKVNADEIANQYLALIV